jgi:hypothetical protein
MVSLQVLQVGLELLGSSDPSTSTSLVAESTGTRYAPGSCSEFLGMFQSDSELFILFYWFVYLPLFSILK